MKAYNIAGAFFALVTSAANATQILPFDNNSHDLGWNRCVPVKTVSTQVADDINKMIVNTIEPLGSYQKSSNKELFKTLPNKSLLNQVKFLGCEIVGSERIILINPLYVIYDLWREWVGLDFRETEFPQEIIYLKGTMDRSKRLIEVVKGFSFLTETAKKKLENMKEQLLALDKK